MINPVLRCALWMNVTWQRCLLVPVTALLIVYLHHRFDTQFSDRMFWLFAFAGVWGGYSLITAQGENHRMRTWHWEVMMPLSPWRLVWSKFVVALFFPWLSGFIIMLPALPHDAAPSVFAGVFLCNCVSLLLGVVLAERMRNSSVIVLWIVLVPIVMAGVFFAESNFIAAKKEWLNWHGGEYEKRPFFVVSALVFSAWALAGAWRVTVRQKEGPLTPVLWAAFLLYVLFYFYGFVAGGDAAWLKRSPFYAAAGSAAFSLCVVAWGTFSFCCYISAFTHCNRAGDLHPFFDAVARGDKRDAARTLPPWLLTAPLLFVVAFAFFFTAEEADLARAVVAAALLVSRDIAVLLLFTLNDKNRLPEGVALFLLLLLYWLLPKFLAEIGGDPAWLSVYYYDGGAVFAAVAGALAQAVFAVWLLWRLRLRSRLR